MASRAVTGIQKGPAVCSGPVLVKIVMKLCGVFSSFPDCSITAAYSYLEKNLNKIIGVLTVSWLLAGVMCSFALNRCRVQESIKGNISSFKVACVQVNIVFSHTNITMT